MQCWTCKRTKEDLQNLGVDSEFEEFEIEGKDLFVCGTCNSLIELIAEGDDEEIDYDDDEEPTQQQPQNPHQF